MPGEIVRRSADFQRSWSSQRLADSCFVGLERRRENVHCSALSLYCNLLLTQDVSDIDALGSFLLPPPFLGTCVFGLALVPGLAFGGHDTDDVSTPVTRT